VIFGTGIHSAVEQHFQAILSGEEQPDVERLMFAYRSAWLPQDPDAITVRQHRNPGFTGCSGLEDAHGVLE
jgi:hypothetical protein